jgi:pimeloyl-ACP methyl ester carboxylesterase
MAPRWSPLVELNGSDDAPSVSQEEWQSCLRGIFLGRLASIRNPQDGAATASVDDVQARAAAHRSRGHVPIFVADFGYEAIRGRVWLSLERSSKPGNDAAGTLPFSNPAELFESRRSFFASALLERGFIGFDPQPFVHAGKRVSFIIPSDGLLGAAAGAKFSVDFGDGLGLRGVPVDQPVTIEYDNYGPRTVTLQAHRPEGASFASFEFVTEEEFPDFGPQYFNQTIPPLTAFRAWTGTAPTRIEALIVRRKDREKMLKPVVIAEGFPGGYKWTEMATYVRRHQFADRLLELGYDLVLVRFLNGREMIQNNAYALMSLIREVIKKRDGNERILLGGFSMGGLIARYTATVWQQLFLNEDPEVEAPQIDKLFTVDSPHEGANVPVGVQAIAQYFSFHDDSFASLMRSPAAQQMLLVWVPRYGEWKEGEEFGASPMRTGFVKALADLGNMPKINRQHWGVTRTIAVATGCPNPQPLAWPPPGEWTVKYWFFGFSGECRAFQKIAGQLVVKVSNPFNVWRIDSVTADTHLDSAPGGVFETPVFEKLWKKLCGADLNEPNKNACFIPVTSALAIAGYNYYVRTPDPNLSKFSHVSWDTRDQKLFHVELNADLAEFLVRFLTEAVSAEEMSASA